MNEMYKENYATYAFNEKNIELCGGENDFIVT